MPSAASAAAAPFAGTIADVPGIAIGHWTDAAAATGCTVALCNASAGGDDGDDAGAVGGVSVRGGSPGTRETDLLHPMRRIQRMHAVVFSGGSAFGLAAADGVQRWLAERGIGFPTAHARVPIVPAAILYDLGIGRADVHPDAAAGYAAGAAAMASATASAAAAATARSPVAAPLAAGSVGAGTGATVAKMWGMDAAVKGGFGSARCLLPGGVSVGAAVAVNAWGGIRDYRNGRLVAGPRQPDGSMCDPVAALLSSSNGAMANGSPQSDAPVNTTIGIVATDAPLDKMQANFVASAAHDGLALTIHPCHTPGDGDTMFCAATGRHPAPVDLTVITTAAVAATAQAVLHAVRSATGLAGVPAVGELGLNSDLEL